MANTKAQIDVVVTGLAALDNLDKKITGVGKVFGGLRAQIAGLGLAAFARSALLTADAINDISDSTGVALGRIKELQMALQEAGGQSEKAGDLLNVFSRKIDEAASGSMKAQMQFRNLGVSLTDLEQNDTATVLDQIFLGISQLNGPTAQAAALMEMFGKGAKGVAAAKLYETFLAARGEGDKYAETIKRAGDLQGQFDRAVSNLKFIFLEAFSPAIQKLVEVSDYLSKNKTLVSELIVLFKVLGITLAAVFGTGVLLAFVRTVGTIGRGIAALPAAFTAISSAAAGTGAALAGAGGAGRVAFGALFTASGAVMKSLRAVAVLVGGVGTAILAAGTLFDDFASQANNALARIIEGIGSLLGVLAGGAVGAAFGSAFGPVGTILGGIAGAFGGDKLSDAVGIPDLIAKARQAREETERLAKQTKDAAKARTDFAATDPRRIDLQSGGGGTATSGPSGVKVDTSQMDAQVKAVKAIGDEYAKNVGRTIEQINLETQLIGQGKVQSEILRAQLEQQNRNKDAITQLKQERDKLNKSETAPEVFAAYDATIAKLEKALSLDKERLSTAINQQNVQQLSDKLLGYSLAGQEAAEKNIQNLQDQKRKNTLPDIQARYQDITNAIRDSAQAAIRAEEAELPRGQKLSQQRIDQIYEAMTVKIKEQKQAIDELVASEEQRKFSNFVLKEQQNLQSELNKATDDYNKMFLSETERRMYDIRSAARDRAKAEVDSLEASRGQKLTTAERLALEKQYYEEAIKGSEELNAQLEKNRIASRSFEYGWKKAFEEYVDDATNAAKYAQSIFQKATTGMEDLIVNFAKTGKFEFKSFMNSILEDLLRSQVRQLMAQIFNIGGSTGGAGGFFGGVGKLLGFANGGIIPTNNPVLVGERGPELISGAAGRNVTPNSALGGGNYVTYNINAVDALSFKQLVASDPAFLYAVTQQGAKTVPQTRR